jgi:hypothetical protein
LETRENDQIIVALREKYGEEEELDGEVGVYTYVWRTPRTMIQFVMKESQSSIFYTRELRSVPDCPAKKKKLERLKEKL